MLIRNLDPVADLAAVTAFQAEAADYWLLAEGVCDPAKKAAEFFTDGPPGCDPARSHRLGLLSENRLSGLAELSFGFPTPVDAYLGLMILAPRLRGKGAGPALLAHIEQLARTAQAPSLYLGVLQANPRGHAFWQRMGFQPTGISRHDPESGHTIHRLIKPL
ncbi:MAG: acetyltransferase domain-containing protein [Rhodobacteraceae bacterium]|uniref:GNAT family N-acetyltransferase n=1 Tax=Cypionkella sp. TaxID=2811411 RepID=UPI00132CB6AC|nr:GNAT family N-acetyltransferase [Cypionkella sp.]KAF0173920.1 MAG: acetyltransferase domain-containing protein [Paracoccaceae bacterium]MDO8327169.1 GNAT family N-acetyltransferase [Cypionkella sp.]